MTVDNTAPARYRIADTLVWRSLSGGGLFVVNRSTGHSFTLNRTAAEFLLACDHGATLEGAIAEVARTIGVSRERLIEDIDQLFAVLKEERIIEPVMEDPPCT